MKPLLWYNWTLDCWELIGYFPVIEVIQVPVRLH